MCIRLESTGFNMETATHLVAIYGFVYGVITFVNGGSADPTDYVTYGVGLARVVLNAALVIGVLRRLECLVLFWLAASVPEIAGNAIFSIIAARNAKVTVGFFLTYYVPVGVCSWMVVYTYARLLLEGFHDDDDEINLFPEPSNVIHVGNHTNKNGDMSA